MIILSHMIVGSENQSKFQRIYKNYRYTMYTVAHDISKNIQDAEDIVAVSFVKIINILDMIDSEDIDRPRGKNLMITITKNTAIDYLRKTRNAPLLCDCIEAHCVEKGAEELYFEMESYKNVVSCIDKMDDKYRAVLRLKAFYYFKSKEIGKILNISEKAVNVRFMRAKSILGEKLMELNNERKT